MYFVLGSKDEETDYFPISAQRHLCQWRPNGAFQSIGLQRTIGTSVSFCDSAIPPEPIYGSRDLKLTGTCHLTIELTGC